MFDIIYARVSTGEQKGDDKTSIPFQIEWGRQKLLDLDSTNKVKVFSEDCSGYEESRPELNKVKELIKAGQVKRLLFWQVDRLSRKASHIDNLREHYFQPYNVEIISDDMSTWDWDESSVFMQQQFGLFSEYWGKVTKKNMMKGKLGLLDKGSVMTMGRRRYVKSCVNLWAPVYLAGIAIFLNFKPRMTA